MQMAENYTFTNLSPIEFEALCLDLIGTHLGYQFERFSEGADGGIDGRCITPQGDVILQAKRYEQTSFVSLEASVKKEAPKVKRLSPMRYVLATSVRLTPHRKDVLVKALNHPSATATDIFGAAELNGLLTQYPEVEKRNIKLWLTSSAVLERLLSRGTSVFTDLTHAEIKKKLAVFVANPSLPLAGSILEAHHVLIVSGPPGIGKTTLAEVLAAQYCDRGWELVAVNDISEAITQLKEDKPQVFLFDDFLGKTRFDHQSLGSSDSRIARFIKMVTKSKETRFILTSRSHIFLAAKLYSEELDSKYVELAELTLDLTSYTREIRARILYNHVYHSGISSTAISSLLSEQNLKKIIDHKNYMPRIVEWMTEDYHLLNADDTQYAELFINLLNNPRRMWEKVFRQHITKECQLILHYIFILGYGSYVTKSIVVADLEKHFGLATRQDPSLDSAHFMEKLRMLEGTFVRINSGRASFVNPSVEDFLQTETASLSILSSMLKACQDWEVLINVWRYAEKTFGKTSANLKSLASDVQMVVLARSLQGSCSLGTACHVLGETLLLLPNQDLILKLRDGSATKGIFIADTALPTVINDLEYGSLTKLPYAVSFSRFLRIKLLQSVRDREDSFELEDMAGLCQNVDECGIGFSDAFYEFLAEAAVETVDGLDIHRFDAESRENSLGDYLNHISKIERVVDQPEISYRRREIEEDLEGYERAAMEHMEDYPRQTSRVTYVAVDNKAGSGEMSDGELRSMFLTLE